MHLKTMNLICVALVVYKNRMRVRRRDRKRGQIFARCWSQDVLGTREDTERVTEETQGQFPVLPTKSETK